MDNFGIRELEDDGITIRIPTFDNVPITGSVQKLMDTPQFQRLRKIRQLSLAHLVYPGANHTRFEHSLGVYSLMRAYVSHLLNTGLTDFASKEDVLSLLAASRLHDVGHYPFGHIVEGMATGLEFHETRGQQICQNLTMVNLLSEMGANPELTGRLISGDDAGLPDNRKKTFRLLRDFLDCAIDADKMDYLERDSVHCGVPYGRSYDKERLINSLIISQDGRLALTEKGKASAEYVIFSRYVMLTEVYWHHTVRSASVMLIRAFQEAQGSSHWGDSLHKLLENFGDEDALEALSALVRDDPDLSVLASGLRIRQLYKRIRTYSPLDPDSQKVFGTLKGLEGPADGRALSIYVEKELGLPRARVLVDIVPAKSLAGDMMVYYPKRDQYRKLSSVSPIASSLHEAWDSLTGIVRVYAHPSYAEKLASMGNELDMIIEKAGSDLRTKPK